MKFVLNKNDQDLFLSLLLENIDTDNPEILEITNGCKYFYFKVYGNTYFLSKSIEKKIKNGEKNVEYVSSIFNLVDEANFYLEEINSEFIDFILINPSNRLLELDSEILALYQSYVCRYE